MTNEEAREMHARAALLAEEIKAMLEERFAPAPAGELIMALTMIAARIDVTLGLMEGADNSDGRERFLGLVEVIYGIQRQGGLPKADT